MRLGLGIGAGERERLWSSSAFTLSKKMICRAGTTQNRGGNNLCFTPKHACDLLSFLHCRSVLGGREHIFSLTKWLTIVIFVS